MPPRRTRSMKLTPEEKAERRESEKQLRAVRRATEQSTEEHARKQDLRRQKKNAKRREVAQQGAINASRVPDDSNSLRPFSSRYKSVSKRVAEHDQSNNCVLFMRLPAELRLLIYEEVVQYRYPTGQRLGSQLLATCKQIHREAGKVLSDNLKSLVLVRVAQNGVRVDQEDTEWDLDTIHPETAVNRWTATLGQRSSVLVHIRRSWDVWKGWEPKVFTINQQLYFLVTALSVTKVKHLHVRIRNYGQAPPIEQRDEALWPLAKASSQLLLSFEGVPGQTVLAIENHRAGLPQHAVSTGLRDWLDAQIAVRQLAELLELANISPLGLRIVNRCLAPMQPDIRWDSTFDCLKDMQYRLAADKVQNMLKEQKWMDFKQEALEKLQQASSGVTG